MGVYNADAYGALLGEAQLGGCGFCQAAEKGTHWANIVCNTSSLESIRDTNGFKEIHVPSAARSFVAKIGPFAHHRA